MLEFQNNQQEILEHMQGVLPKIPIQIISSVIFPNNLQKSDIYLILRHYMALMTDRNPSNLEFLLARSKKYIYIFSFILCTSCSKSKALSNTELFKWNHLNPEFIVINCHALMNLYHPGIKHLVLNIF